MLRIFSTRFLLTRIFLSACFAFFSGWAAFSQAVPLTEPLDEPETAVPAPALSPSKSPPSKSSASKESEPSSPFVQPSADFVCPHANKVSAIECFLDGVEHFYTVCRQVKAIELLEFGFDHAEEGANGLKSEFCRRKQKASLPPYLDAALHEAQAMSSCEAARALDDLYVVWNAAMTGLRQYPGDTEAEYRQRIAVPYSAFAAYRQQIRDTLTAAANQQPAQSCPDLTAFTP
ncbi:MAG: hypothetical protein LBB65_09035 [Burkholderiales bacterium]|nr:hypothetical protein [Burkholderiales bacterium]